MAHICLLGACQSPEANVSQLQVATENSSRDGDSSFLARNKLQAHLLGERALRSNTKLSTLSSHVPRLRNLQGGKGEALDQLAHLRGAKSAHCPQPRGSDLDQQTRCSGSRQHCNCGTRLTLTYTLQLPNYLYTFNTLETAFIASCLGNKGEY